ncbi:MAG TPA: hypothetical protein VFE35_01430 [Candidatus Cybelea sp.]|jgi:hypothetical protein|nr:hypothetical protein [Candidatus Cybelea sp.]
MIKACFAGATLVLVAGCSGGNGLPTASGIPPAARAQNWFHSAVASPKLYISNATGGVAVYSTGSNPQLLQTITHGVPRTGGIWVDKRGILYAVNVPISSQQTSLPEYKPGASSPFRTITNGIVNCSYVAVDKLENVYVTGVDTSNESFFLEIYRNGQLSPSQTLTIPHPQVSRVSGLAFDLTGALLVGESVYLKPGVVYRLAPASQNFTNLNLQNAPGGAIAVDKAGNLYAGSGSSAGAQAIAVYAPNSTTPSRQIAVQNILGALAVKPDGELYTETGGDGPPQISVYAPGSNSPMQTFDAAAGGISLALSR